MNYRGMNKEQLLGELIPDTAPHGKNMVYLKSHGSGKFQNEPGFQQALYKDTQICVGAINTSKGIILFFTTLEQELCEIGLLRHNHFYTVLIKDDLLSLSAYNPIEGTYFINNKDELVIAWWEGLSEDANRPRYLNTDCFGFDVDPTTKAFINPQDVELLELFPSYYDVDMELVSVQAGGSLKTGVYYVAVATIFDDGGNSNYFRISNAISINSSTSDVFTEFDGDPAGTDSSKSFTFKISGIPTIYKNIRIAIIKKIGGVISAVKLPDVPVTAGEAIFSYGNDENTEDVSLEEVLVSTINYSRAETGTSLNNRLYLANLATDAIPNLQPFINNWKVRWVSEDDIKLNKLTDSYKDPVFIFDKRIFKTDEVYALYAIVYFKNGAVKAFNLPGRAQETYTFIDDNTDGWNVAENATVQSILDLGAVSQNLNEAIALNPDARLHEIENTARSNGKLGYWENQSETYPDADCWDILDSGGIVGTLRNEKVRHHKIPSQSKLQNFTGDLRLDIVSDSCILTQYGASGVSANYVQWAELDPVPPDYATVVNSPTVIIFTFVRKVRLRIDWGVNTDGGIVNGHYTILHKKVSEPAVAIVEVDLSTITTTGNSTFVLIDPGDQISVQCFEDGAGTITLQGTYFMFEDYSLEPHRNANLGDPAIRSYLVGLKFLDMYLPSTELEKIARIELGFAERTVDNMTVLSNGLMHIDNATNILRAWPFDSLRFRLPVPDYVSAQLMYQNWYPAGSEPTYMRHQFFPGDFEYAYGKIRKVSKMQYMPAYTNTPDYDNTEESEFLYGEYGADFPDLLPEISGGYTDWGFYTDFKAYKSNVYLGVDKQKIVSTGHSFLIPFDTTQKFYGGDTFLSLYGMIRYFKYVNDEDVAIRNFPILFYCESIANVNFRHGDIETNNAYSPNVSDPCLDKVFLPEELPAQLEPTYDYNEDYQSLNNLIPVSIFVCDDSCTPAAPSLEKYPYRIHRSLPMSKENSVLRWREFLANDYYEMDRNRGPIMSLKAYSMALMIHMDAALFVAQIRDVISGESIAAIYVGSGDIFDRPPRPIGDNESGYAGCQSKFSSAVTPIGYVFTDNRKGRGAIFIFDGNLREISKVGMREFFRDNLSLIDPDAKMQYNPYLGTGMAIGWDNHHERLLFTRTMRDRDGFLKTTSWTFSFFPEDNIWVCEHDYYPSMMFDTINGLYSIVNENGNEICEVARHNHTNFGTYHFGTLYPAYIDIVIGKNDGTLQRLLNVVWEAELLTTAGNADYKKGFTNIAVYNKHQSTGLIPIQGTAFKPLPPGNSRFVYQAWRFNEIRDLITDGAVGVTDSKGNLVNINATKAWHKRLPVIGNTAVVRLYLTNAEQKRLYLFDVFGEFKPFTR